MKDQIDALRQLGIAASRLDSSLSADEYRAVLGDLRSGKLRLLYVAPERFNNERFRSTIMGTRVSLFAVDEAHCISEWGHNFRPDYLKLAEFARRCHAERILALTATATPQVLLDMCSQFDIESEHATCTGFYRNNLTLLSTPVHVDDRDSLLIERLRARESGPTIIYVTLQKTAQEVAKRLCREGFESRPYHAGMKDEDRADTQDWFLESETGIVVATIAFGMGVDKSNIRYIYHYNLPKSLENYSQEIGRAGRDGEPAICEMLLCGEDLNVLENFAYGDTPTLEAASKFVETVLSSEEEFDVSFYELANSCDIRILVVRTFLTYLELSGVLEGGTPFYAGYRFKPKMSSKRILEHFQGERVEFVKQMLKQSRQARSWFHIDLDQAATACGTSRDRVVRALDYLGEQGMLELSASGVRHKYRRLSNDAKIEPLARKLHERAVERERREIARLHQVVELANSRSCRVDYLCRHFGENFDRNCGHCSHCLSDEDDQQNHNWNAQTAEIVDNRLIEETLRLKVDYPALEDAHSLARFLCGATSPRLIQARLTRHSLFGAAQKISYRTVFDQISGVR